MSKTYLLAAMVLILLLLLPLTACVKIEKPATDGPTTTSEPMAVGNRPPVISNLSAANYQVYPQGTSEIQVVAADPDGDKVDISWQATGGKINGNGYVVNWQAPKEYGSYTITAVAGDGKGGSAQQSINISVNANQAPQISSLAAKPTTVGFGQSVVITCTAVDPDGDVISYNWKADEGNITGVGPTVTWFAPSKQGTFNIFVTLSDNKGGDTIGNVAVTVAGATKTVSLVLVQEESGTVASDGDKDLSRLRAGDDDKNVGYRAFFTFNVFQLNKAEVREAKLIFTTKNVIGNPFIKAGAQSLNGLWIKKVNFSGGLPSFNIIGQPLSGSGATIYAPPTVVDVKPELVTIVNAGGDRFQVVAALDKIGNSNDIAEYIEWIDAKLEVTYVDK